MGLVTRLSCVQGLRWSGLLISAVLKNPPASTGDLGLIPGSGRSLEEEMATHFVSNGSQESWTQLTRREDPSLISNCSAPWNSQKVMKAVVLPIRNENQKGLCAWDPHRALLCSFNTRKNIFHFAISLVITEKKSLHSILDIMCMIRQ